MKSFVKLQNSIVIRQFRGHSATSQGLHRIDKDSLCMYDIVFVPRHLESLVHAEASAYYMGLSYCQFRLSY
jgi:hypothetical protein